MDITVVQDHIAQRGGAERVLRSLTRLPTAVTSVRTSVFVAEHTYPELADVDVQPMWFSRVPALRRNHRLAFPLMAPSFALSKTDTDITLCCTAGWSHGIRTPGRKVAYWFAPARWIHQQDQYVGSKGLVARTIRGLSPVLEWFDRRAVESIDRHLAVSEAVATRLRDTYGIDAEVVHPPVVLDAEPEPIETVDGPIVLVVSRLISYKNVDVVIDAFKDLPDVSLYVVGSGPLSASLEARASKNVHFTGLITDGQLISLYARCDALVTAAYEDFGLTPVEAALHGKPSAGLRAGGLVESINEDVTGVLFDEPTPKAIAAGVREVLGRSWDDDKIRTHAQGFGEDRFLHTIDGILRAEAEQ